MAADVRTSNASQELTIVAASSGALPSAIAIIRVSGSQAFPVAEMLCGTLPPEREARVRPVRDPETGELLDRALLIRFAAPATATGEDVVEFHCHGSRAVVAGIEAAIAGLPGCCRAVAGEFTRRALLNGRIDLTQAEALGELLQAETATQRRQALRGVEGFLGQAIVRWQTVLIHQAALIEAILAFEDEEEVAGGEPFNRSAVNTVATEIEALLANPPAERLRDGVRVVLAGPANAGKSTLLNALAGRDVAIVSAIAGTTRDRIEAPVQRRGVAFILTDTAGLRQAADAVEALGIERTHEALGSADLIVWLGDEPPGFDAIWIEPRCDAPGRATTSRLHVSAVTGEGVEQLWSELLSCSKRLLPQPDEHSLNARQRFLLSDAYDMVVKAHAENDLVLTAERFRVALRCFDTITGAAGIENVVDELFATFCLGK